MRKIYKSIVVLMVLMLLTSCGRANVNESSTAESIVTSVGSSSEEESSKEESEEYILVFSDYSVQKAAEEICGKKATEFDESDYELLKAQEYLSSYFSSNPTQTLADLPEYFPNLKYLHIYEYNGVFSAEDSTIIKNMENLIALTISCTEGYDTFDFIVNLRYVNLKIDVESTSDERKAEFNSLSVHGADTFSEYFSESIQKYVRILYNDEIYESAGYDNEGYSDSDTLGLYKVFVTDSDNNLQNVLEVNEDLGNLTSTCGNLFIMDVNFDGKDDILVGRGGFGNRGYSYYTCFINTGSDYQINESFSYIENVGIDYDNKVILCWHTNSAASYGFEKYSYINGKFISTNQLTIEYSGEEPYLMTYTEEAYEDGEWVLVDVYNNEGLSEADIQDKYYIEDSFWELDSDKWGNLGSYYNLMIAKIVESSGTGEKG